MTRDGSDRRTEQEIDFIGAGGGTRTPTGLPLLDFESVEFVTYQILSGHTTQNQRSFLSRVAPLCPVCAVGLGTNLGTVGAYRKPAAHAASPYFNPQCVTGEKLSFLFSLGAALGTGLRGMRTLGRI